MTEAGTIVERLQKIIDAPDNWGDDPDRKCSVAVVAVQDILDAVVDLKAKAGEIERLQARVKELEDGLGEIITQSDGWRNAMSESGEFDDPLGGAVNVARALLSPDTAQQPEKAG